MCILWARTWCIIWVHLMKEEKRKKKKKIHIQYSETNKLKQKWSKHLSNLTCEYAFSSFNISKREPTCFTFALSLGPTIVRHLFKERKNQMKTQSVSKQGSFQIRKDNFEMLPFKYLRVYEFSLQYINACNLSDNDVVANW